VNTCDILVVKFKKQNEGPSWPWSYGSWIYSYLCNQCLSPLMLWIRITISARCTTLCDKVCQWLATGRWFSPGSLVSSTNKTGRHDITEILLKVVLNTIKQTNKMWLQLYIMCYWHWWVPVSFTYSMEHNQWQSDVSSGWMINKYIFLTVWPMTKLVNI